MIINATRGVFMKSNKYQLLEFDYKALERDLKMHKEVIESQRKRLERYEKALKLVIQNTVPGHVKHIAKRALEENIESQMTKIAT
jgi:hypothetical protein